MNVAILGYGKMGKEIEKILIQKGHTIPLKINSTNSDHLTSNNLKEIDIAIEFSGPEAAYANIMACLKNNTPVVSGSTGWLKNIDDVEQYTTDFNTAFLYASNFSLGVNVFFALNEKLGKLLSANKDYTIAIEETHHVDKKDAPSGTAITLASQIINQSKNRYSKWSLVEKQGDEEANENKLPIISKREPEVPGTHIVKYESPEDNITLSHVAHNRKGFALGAVIAAEFLHDKKGIYSMKDVLDV